MISLPENHSYKLIPRGLPSSPVQPRGARSPSTPQSYIAIEVDDYG
jgi:hypothetical protein